MEKIRKLLHPGRKMDICSKLDRKEPNAWLAPPSGEPKEREKIVMIANSDNRSFTKRLANNATVLKFKKIEDTLGLRVVQMATGNPIHCIDNLYSYCVLFGFTTSIPINRNVNVPQFYIEFSGSKGVEFEIEYYDDVPLAGPQQFLVQQSRSQYLNIKNDSSVFLLQNFKWLITHIYFETTIDEPIIVDLVVSNVKIGSYDLQGYKIESFTRKDILQKLDFLPPVLSGLTSEYLDFRYHNPLGTNLYMVNFDPTIKRGETSSEYIDISTNREIYVTVKTKYRGRLDVGSYAYNITMTGDQYTILRYSC